MEIRESNFDKVKAEVVEKGSVEAKQIFISPAVKQKIDLKVLLANAGVYLDGQKEGFQNERIPATISPSDPLVSVSSANPIVAAASIISGFDVTGPTPVSVAPEVVPTPEPTPSVAPVSQPVPEVPSNPLVDTPIADTSAVPLQMGDEEDKTVENAIDAQIDAIPGPVVEETPEVAEAPANIIPESVNPVMNTPEQNLASPEVQVTENVVPEVVPVQPKENPFIETNVEIEKLRNEVNGKIDKISNDLSLVKTEFNSSLDAISRRVEAQRQLLDETVKNANAQVTTNNNAIAEAVQNGVESLDGVQTPVITR